MGFPSPIGTAEAFAAGRGKPQGCGLRVRKAGCRISPDPKPDAISRGNREAAVTSGGAGVARGRRRAPPGTFAYDYAAWGNPLIANETIPPNPPGHAAKANATTPQNPPGHAAKANETIPPTQAPCTPLGGKKKLPPHDGSNQGTTNENENSGAYCNRFDFDFYIFWQAGHFHTGARREIGVVLQKETIINPVHRLEITEIFHKHGGFDDVIYR